MKDIFKRRFIMKTSSCGTGYILRKMTGATADRFQLKDRGYLKEGYYADLTVFNEGTIKDATPDQKKSFGIEQVFINGKRVLSDDELDEAVLRTSGMALPVM